MIAKIFACFSGLSAAESGWLLGRVIFHAADVNNFGVSSNRLSSLKGKGNFIIICSGPAPSAYDLCAHNGCSTLTRWNKQTTKWRRRQTPQVTITARSTAFFSSRRCLVDQAKILIESTSTWTLFTSRQQRDCCSPASLLWFLQLL